MRNLLNTRPNPTPMHRDEHTLGEYVETMDNTPILEKKEEPSVEWNSNMVTINKHGENTDNTQYTTEIEIEDDHDAKSVLDKPIQI